MNWNAWIRQTHRWLSIAFTVTVIANFVALARGGGAMPHHGLAQGRRFFGLAALDFERWDVRRRRWRCRGEEIFEHPLPTQHGRGSRRIRRDGQEAAVAEQTTACAVGGQGDSTEVAAAHVRDPIVPGQPLVQERVIGVEQIEHAALLPEDAVDEELRLAAHCRS